MLTLYGKDSDQTTGWMIWILFPAETREIFILKVVQTGSRFPPSFPRDGYRDFLQRYSSCEAHLQRVQSLRMSGAIPLLSLYTFIVRKVTTLPCYTITHSAMIP